MSEQPTFRTIPDPEDCPEPIWHKTHRYCPHCTWAFKEPPKPPTPLELENIKLKETIAKIEEVMQRRYVWGEEGMEAHMGGNFVVWTDIYLIIRNSKE